jgi:hypothetical protein
MKLQAPIELTDNVYLQKRPLFVQYKSQHHKVKGHEVRRILDLLLPGDILLRRFDGYLNTILTPRFWEDAALYVGDNNVIHAVGKGVIKEDILDFCRCDSICVLRVKNDFDLSISVAIAKAKDMYNRRVGYDYEFETGDNKVYCTEIVNECYDGLFNDDYEMVAGNRVLTPDGIRNSKCIRVFSVIEIKH